MLTELVYHHANPAFHKGYEVYHIRVAAKLTEKGSINTYEDYLDLCGNYCILPYHRELWDAHIAKKPHKK